MDKSELSKQINKSIEKHCLVEKQFNFVFKNKKGEIKSFSYAKNEDSGSYLYWVSVSVSMFISNLPEIKKMVKYIKNNHIILLEEII